MTKDDGLYASGVTVRYAGVVANDDVSLQVPRGSVVGLIGPNGAGKTSFVDAISGFARYMGEVHLDGRPLDGLRTHERRRRGLARTWQAIELFNDLTVLENAQLPASRFATAALGRGVRRGPDLGHELLGRVGMADFAHLLPGQLSLGQQKLIGVARALSGSPLAVILDEPAAGLNQSESELLGAQVRRLADDDGLSILLIEHDIRLVRQVCDFVTVLDLGRVIAQGPPEMVVKDAGVVAAYLGEEEVE